MMYRVFSVVLVGLAVLALVGAPVDAGGVKKEEQHTGKFLSASGVKFMMEQGGKEHSHTLAPDAKVINADGKECKLTDLVKGQTIRVTTRADDKITAMRVEVLKEREKDK